MGNEPVAVNGIVTLVASVLTVVLARFGIDEEGSQQIAAIIGAIITAVISLVAIWNARGKVTPVSNPYDNEGNHLTPEGT